MRRPASATALASYILYQRSSAPTHVGPLAQADGPDGVGHCHKVVPGLAGSLDDGVVIFEVLAALGDASGVNARRKPANRKRNCGRGHGGEAQEQKSRVLPPRVLLGDAALLPSRIKILT
jgi:hypothetical protein